MNFLQICQRVAREAGMNSVGLSSVVSQSGENQLVVDWVNAAWEDLQLARPNWFWLRGAFNFNTTASDGGYTSTEAGIATRFLQWDKASLSIYNTATGVASTSYLQYLPYDIFRDAYLTGTVLTGKPLWFTVSPAGALLLSSVPNDIYTVKGEYLKTPQTLSLDADIPEMPSAYHMAIMYRALMKYARFDAANEIYGDALTEYRRIFRQIELNQLPDVELSGALA